MYEMMRLGLGLLPARPRGGNAPASLQIVGSRGEIYALQSSARSSTNVKQVGRTRHYIGTQAVSEFQIGFNNFFLDTATSGNGQTCAEVDCPNGHIVRASLEINGVVHPVTFSGSNDGFVPVGAILYLSDAIQPASFGLTEFAPQTEMWLKCEREYVVGAFSLFHQTSANSPAIDGERFMAGATTAPSQLANVGPLVEGSGWAPQAHLWFPYCMLGLPKAQMFAAVTVGASIENGVSDGYGDGLNGAGGYMRRMLANVGGDKVARVHLAKSGETAKSFLANSTKRRQMLQYANHCFSGHGGNDYSTGETLADTQTRWTALWALLKQDIGYVEHYSLAPKTNSTDAWATLVNQTPRQDFQVGGTWRDAGNAWLAAQPGVDPNLDAFVDLNAAMQAATAADKWRVDLGQPTVDGTHPSGVVANAMATANDAHLQALLAAYEG